MQERMLRITGVQEIAGEEPDVIELMTMGRIYEKDGYIYIVYKDEGLSDAGEKLTTTLKVCNESVKLLRFGEDRTPRGRMDFITGERYEGIYNTPFGNLDVTIDTEGIENRLSEADGGYLNIFYDMAITGTAGAKNKLKIEIVGEN